MSRTPNYKIIENCTCIIPREHYSEKQLEAGSFVRPIDDIWLPSHIISTKIYKYHDPKTEIFVYSRLGIVLIPKKVVRKV